MHLFCLLAECVWGQGLTTELLETFITHCEEKEPIRLVAGVKKNNRAAARVLRKMHFQVANDLSSACTDVFVREVGRSEFTDVNSDRSSSFDIDRPAKIPAP
jgi:RimJ/RimL family protein N-acetyltransferase